MEKIRLIELYENRKEVGEQIRKIMNKYKIKKKYITKTGVSYEAINNFLNGEIKNITTFAKYFAKFRLVLGDELYSVIN